MKFLLVSLLLSLSFSQDCYESTIVSPTPFMGNNGEVFKLSDGSFWEVKYEYEYMYEYYPSVIICPRKNLAIIGDTRLNVEVVSNSNNNSRGNSTGNWRLYEETYIQGTLTGVIKKGHIFKTMSGNYYEIVDYTIEIVLEVMPDVTVFKKGNQYKLVVDGFNEPILCKKL